DLARDEPGERLLVVLDQPADLLDRPSADRCGDGGPLALSLARGLAGGDEGGGVAEPDVRDDVVGVGRVDGGRGPAGAVGQGAAVDDRGDGAGGGSGR